MDRFLDTLDSGARILGPIMVLCALSLISADSLAFYVVIFPPMRGGATYWQSLMGLLWVFAVCNLLYNYAMCIFSDPGRVKGLSLRAQLAVAVECDPSYVRGAAAVLAEAKKRANTNADDSSFSVRWCDECHSPKPPRVHHCSVCRACVLKMDHHCPWVNNCVGARTYPFFLRFLAWTFFCTVFFGYIGKTVFWTQLTRCDPAAAKLLSFGGGRTANSVNPAPLGLNGLLEETRGEQERERGGRLGRRLFEDLDARNHAALAPLRPRPSAGSTFLRSVDRRFTQPLLSWIAPNRDGCSSPFLILYIVTLSLAGSLSLLGGFHVFLAARGLTSIEFYKAPRSVICGRSGGATHPFSETTFLGNYRGVFTTGCFSGAWLLPPAVSLMLCGEGGGGGGTIQIVIAPTTKTMTMTVMAPRQRIGGGESLNNAV